MSPEVEREYKDLILLVEEDLRHGRHYNEELWLYRLTRNRDRELIENCKLKQERFNAQRDSNTPF